MRLEVRRIGAPLLFGRLWEETGCRAVLSRLMAGRGFGFDVEHAVSHSGQAKQWRLDELSLQVTPGAHAVLILDRAGWHTTGKRVIPVNIALVPLPPRAPESFVRVNVLEPVRGVR